jgi:hypothetical protein
LLLAARAVALGEEASTVPQMQLAQPTQDAQGTAQQSSSPPVIVERRPRSVPLLCSPECTLVAAVAANDIVAVEVALDRGEQPTFAMLQEFGLDSAIIQLLCCYLAPQSS